MSDDLRYMPRTQAELADIDVGLRKYMLRVYNYMASGLLLTGIVAYGAVKVPAIMNTLYTLSPNGYLQPTGLTYLVMFAPLGFILFLSMGINRMKASTAQAVFWAFATVTGLSLTNIFLVYTGASIARVFFITAATFGAMSLYGYTTKRDLSKFGSFLFMGLIGILIAMVVNWFLKSPALYYTISALGVLVFVGFTAYDTQKVKLSYNEGDNSETSSKKAIMGALHLYLDFLNLFLMLLHLFGNRE